MTMDIDLRRRFFAEELEAVCRLRTPGLVDAFARVPREQFLPAGPWTVLADSADSYLPGRDLRTRLTPDADPARVHHNIAVAILARRAGARRPDDAAADRRVAGGVDAEQGRRAARQQEGKR